MNRNEPTSFDVRLSSFLIGNYTDRRSLEALTENNKLI